MESIDFSDLNSDNDLPKFIRRDFVCALAVSDNQWYSPSNRVHISEKVEE